MATTINGNDPLWKQVIQIVITILTAIVTTFSVTSCMGV